MKKNILLCVIFWNCFIFAQEEHFLKKMEQTKKMVWVEGGKVTIGNKQEADAQPLFTAEVTGFWIQKYEVTNAQFKEFVEATGYITLAEKKGGAYVFLPNKAQDSSCLKEEQPWWHFVQGANWKHPTGKTSTIRHKKWYPVVQIAHKDAMAYCEWADLRLPTEVEREYAARKNGMVDLKNTWKGDFPYTSSNKDRFVGTAPVGSFKAGKLGLFDMQGNVWEWCRDPYNQHAYYYAKERKPSSNEVLVPNYFDPLSPTVKTYVIRGGSYLCADSYCMGYKIGRRMRASEEMAFGHIGFRCVKER